LTTYGEAKYSHPNEPDKKPAPPKLNAVNQTASSPSSQPPQGIPSLAPQIKRKSAKDDLPPPVFEISVFPPDDESSLGSMGFLFASVQNMSRMVAPRVEQKPPEPLPAKVEEKARDERDYYKSWTIGSSIPYKSWTIPGSSIPRTKSDDDIDRADPSFQNMSRMVASREEQKPPEPLPTTLEELEEKARDDNDFYKSWIIPGSSIPRAKSHDDIDRADPPGTKTSFSNTVTQHTYPASNHQEQRSANQILQSSSTGTALNSYHSVSDAQSELESWVPTTNFTGTPKVLTKRPTRTKSDASFGSNWAPPAVPLGAIRETREVENDEYEEDTSTEDVVITKAQSIASDSEGSKSTWGWLPPTFSRRVDFTGAINSQPVADQQAAQNVGANSKKDFSDDPWIVPGMDQSSNSTASSRSEETSKKSNDAENPGFDADPFGSSSGDDSKSGSQSRSDGGSASVEGSIKPFDEESRSKSDSESEVWSKIEGRSNRSAVKAMKPNEVHFGMPEQAPFSSPQDEGSEEQDARRSNRAVKAMKPNEVHFVMPEQTPLSRSQDEGSEEQDVEQARPAKNNYEPQQRRLLWKAICLFAICALVLLAIVLAVVLTLGGDDPSPNTSGGGNLPTPNTPTQPPSQPPSEDLFTLISSFSPGSANALNNPSSPQSKAFDWLSGNQFLAQYTKVKKLQRYVLAVLYYSANGGNWRNSELWLSDIDECDWYTSEAENGICNSQGQLDEIDLENNILQGALPWNELSILESQLLVLDFNKNELAGTISTSVGVFESLLVLDLFGNKHTGTIPTQLGGVTSLRYLDFSSNLLTGTLPRELSNMRGLQSLLLRDNLLSGTIPSQLGSLASLRNLHLVSLAVFRCCVSLVLKSALTFFVWLSLVWE
jgi:hypothetical protein